MKKRTLKSYFSPIFFFSITVRIINSLCKSTFKQFQIALLFINNPVVCSQPTILFLFVRQSDYCAVPVIHRRMCLAVAYSKAPSLLSTFSTMTITTIIITKLFKLMVEFFLQHSFILSRSWSYLANWQLLSALFFIV